MSKQQDIDDLLGGDAEAKPAKKTKAKKAEEAPAPEKAKKATKAKKAEEAPVETPPVKAERAPKEPIVFEEGEREELAKRIKKSVRKPINSRELAEKMGVQTRKLRTVLYAMQKRNEIALEAGASKVAGMTVSPAA